MSYGPAPWQQTQWDWRAAANFVCGGAGGGLIVFAALSGAQGPMLALLLLGGLALVGTGLVCVWLEIGRPLRALHVFFNPRTSWMTREAFVALLLMPVVLAAAAGLPGFKWLAAVLALAFVYCQGRILQAAKGIPAWREPLLVPLIVATGLVEGGGALLLWHAVSGLASTWAWLGFALALLARGVLWHAWRRRVKTAARAQAAIDGAGRVFQLATWLPLAAALVALASPLGGDGLRLLQAAAGAAALGGGLWFKFTLITRGAFNQGFALAHLPVRGVPRRKEI